MASAVACKAAELHSGLENLRAESSASGAPVSFYALSPAAITAHGKEVRRYDDSIGELDRKFDDADSGDGRRVLDFVVPNFFSQGDDALGAPKSLSQMLSLLKDVGAQTGLPSTAGAARLARWVAKEDDDAVYLKVPMPGLAKEHVKVRAEKNILVIKGEGDMGPFDSAVPAYNHRIDMPADAYKMDQIKGEMKNGVLWLTVLKVKEEERKDVFQVKIE